MPARAIGKSRDSYCSACRAGAQLVRVAHVSGDLVAHIVLHSAECYSNRRPTHLEELRDSLHTPCGSGLCGANKCASIEEGV